jgi:hypothetical protein
MSGPTRTNDVMLRDMPGFAQFAKQLSESVADISLALAGENEEQVQAVLDQTRGNLTSQLTGVIGAKTATEIADAFIEAVRCRRREIDGEMPRVFN